MTRELEVLKEVNLLSVQPPKAIWQNDTIVIEALHQGALEEVTRRRRQLREGQPRRNIVLEGRSGAGKSHFLGRVRRETITAGDFFVVVELNEATDFWQSVALDIVESLRRPHSEVEVSQRTVLLHEVLRACRIDEDITLALVAGSVDEAILPRVRLAVARTLGGGKEARVAADVALALVLLNSDDFEHQDIGFALFEGVELDEDQRLKGGLQATRREAREVVRAFDALVGLSGHVVVVALDQIDGLIAIAEKSHAEGDHSKLNIIANNLMDLAQLTDRTIVIISCMRETWALIRDEAIESAKYRFQDHVRLGELPSADCGRELIAEVLGKEYARLGFAPPSPTWPVAASAFEDAPDYTPRRLIILVDEHVKRCVGEGKARLLERFDGAATPPPKNEGGAEGAAGNGTAPPDTLAAIDARFEALKVAAPALPLDDVAIETALPPLLFSALAAFVGENAGRASLSVDEIAGDNPAINARLRIVLDASREDEIHWCFKVLAQPNGRAQCYRLKAAVTKSGLGRQRRLVVIRNTPWNNGPKTQEVLEAFHARNGIVAALTAEDVRIFGALHALMSERPEGLGQWLAARRPASATALLSHIALSAAPEGPGPGSGTRDTRADGPPGRPPQPSAVDAPGPRVPEGHILVGRTPDGSGAITLPLEVLRRHVAVFAGSGSGKTVLLRRLIEACALEGVSSIVLDPNNDLARLGTVAADPHPGWIAGDAERAARYAREVETVVWTPRMTSGRPLSFAPLAGLSGIEDPDEFEVAVDCAVELLAPRARLSSATAKGTHGRAVLKRAVKAYVRLGDDSLGGFLGFLAALPEGVSNLESGEKLAAEMAETLKAEAEIDPMFGDTGQALDPAALLTPSAGRRARISVISFVGLPNLEQQQVFVSQLQLAVFAWIKKHPAGDCPLGGLFVIDEAQNFAPSGGSTPSTATTLALASQARKYGLGLMFATQAPKGLHNRVPGNCTTQLFGFLNASAQIAAANELAAHRGGRVPEIASLRPGQFYIASDGLTFSRVNTPFCLTHHPPSPLTQEEVLSLAANGRLAA